MLSTLGNWASIASFLLSIALLVYSETLRKEIQMQKREYIRAQGELKTRLTALRENIWDGKPLTLKFISEIRTLIFSFPQQFGNLDTRKDKAHYPVIESILAMKPDAIDRYQLCAELDYFIARLDRKEQE